MISKEQEYLISRYGSGDLSPAEAQALETLLKENPQGAELLEQYRLLDLQLAEMPDAGADVDFETFSKTLNESLTKSTIQHRHRWLKLPSARVAQLAAAATLMITALAWLVFKPTQIDPPDNLPTTTVTLVMPTTKSYNQVVNVSLAMPLATKQKVDQQAHDQPPGQVLCYVTHSAKSDESTRRNDQMILMTPGI